MIVFINEKVKKDNLYFIKIHEIIAKEEDKHNCRLIFGEDFPAVWALSDYQEKLGKLRQMYEIKKAIKSNNWSGLYMEGI